MNPLNNLIENCTSLQEINNLIKNDTRWKENKALFVNLIYNKIIELSSFTSENPEIGTSSFWDEVLVSTIFL